MMIRHLLAAGALALALCAAPALAQNATGYQPAPGNSTTNVNLTGGKNGSGAATALAVDVNGVVAMYATGNVPVLANGLSTTVVTVVGAAAVLEGYYCYNPNAAVAYVQIFDISGTVTLATSTPKWSIGIPATSAANLSNLGVSFANAIKVAATTTAGGSTANATALDCNFVYH